MNMLSLVRNRSIAFKLVLFILSSCVIIFAGIFTYNYGVSRRMLVNKIEDSARNLISGTVSKIESKILPAEKVPEFLSIAMTKPDIGKDDIIGLLRMVLEKNPEIYGSAIAFEPYAFDKDQVYYSPYACRKNGTIEFTDLGTDEYAYPKWGWYKTPKKLDRPVWSEPYYDTGGGETLMVTYSVPFYRETAGKKKFTGIVTADLSLAWLEKMVSSLKIGKTGYGFLVSKKGMLITHPDKSLVMKNSVLKMPSKKNMYLFEVGDEMVNGEIGFVPTKDAATGKRIWIAYAPVPATDWSLAAVFPKGELMEDLHNLNRIVLLIGSLGLFFLTAVIYLFSNSITKPLKLLASRTRDIAKGNMDFDLPISDSKDEVGSLARALRYMKTELKDYISRLTKTTQEKEKIQSELKIARRIQLGTLPRVIPPFTGRDEFEICATMRAAKEVGGDFYDFYFIDDKHLAFTIGDVSGKGVPAAIYVAIAKTYIQSIAKVVKEPEEILTRVNKALAHDNIAAMFVTVFFGILNIETGEMRYSNAGHNLPMIIRNGKDPEFFEKPSGCVLGAFEDAPMGEGKTQFHPGDTLYMYTDGVTEAMNINKEEFTDERLKERLTIHKDDSIKKMVEGTFAAVEAFARGAEQADDITILILRYFGKEGPGKHAGKSEEYQIKNEIPQIRVLANFMEEFGKKNGIPDDLMNDVNLSLEELIHNTISYGYEDGSLHFIDVRIRLKDKELLLEIVDDAKAFNPLETPKPDVNKPLEDRTVGGLGIFIVRNIMDKVEYKRKKDKNILILKKAI
ncbi:MAG: SpoIIE family protein phosphatase [Candidatus Tantalella remota]|nr:SpoIIE family protein phosphatase [Candidatus Tantalella remota]